MQFPRRILLRLLVVVSATSLFISLPRGTSASGFVLLPGIPALRQQHSLTCESSAASMATKAALTEGQIMAAMPRSANPNLGFRGNPNGFQGTTLTDYGVYAAPVHRALLKYGYRSDLLLYANDAQIKSYVSRGWPVVAWMTYQLQPAVPRLMRQGGVSFVLVPHEHAITIIGYDGATVMANDPWVAKQVRYYWKDFNRSWGLFGNMALAIQPCPIVSPVNPSSLQLTHLAKDGFTLTWSKSKHATAYVVDVTLHGKTQNQTVLHATLSGQSVNISNPPRNANYLISVQATSSCGGTSTPARYAVHIPGRLPGPSPTPTPTEAAISTPTPSPTPSPTSSSTPDAGATGTATVTTQP